MKNRTKKLVLTALLAALTCIATMVFKVPSPLNGYVNLGDSMVLTAGWVLSPGYAFLAAGLGSALADLFSGYVIYAPATFVIKGLMALIALGGLRLLGKRFGTLPSRILGGIAAEIGMILGYLGFESVLYGFVASLVNVGPNGVQGVAGLVIGLIVVKILEKSKGIEK